EMLRGKPVFKDVAGPFLDFIGDAPLVIHNASFDMKFLNAELRRLERPPLAADRAIDTVMIARKRFPGAPASLDALCRRFEISLEEREAAGHGALLDCLLLAKVYLELTGGRQPGLNLSAQLQSGQARASHHAPARQRPRSLPPLLTQEEAAAHEKLVSSLKGDVLWLRSAAIPKEP
ncbi:MAG TPA: DNA polymerase III subunit epsilon, partial [Alphaproteobacteria bacterium]|nr:DNA polymerase III subunit epsilon [Alphaproteobacteria bacterium]